MGSSQGIGNQIPRTLVKAIFATIAGTATVANKRTQFESWGLGFA